MTKEELKKEAEKVYMKAYRAKNRDVFSQRNKARFELKKLPYNIVYCIPNYDNKGNDYCGVTNQPYYRMKNHRNTGKLNVSEWYELGKVVDRKEAEALEGAFHKLGYHGADPNHNLN